MQNDSVYPGDLVDPEESLHLLYKGMAQVHFTDLWRRVQVSPNLFGLWARAGAAARFCFGQCFYRLANLALQPT
jgi:hypothetical protein